MLTTFLFPFSRHKGITVWGKWQYNMLQLHAWHMYICVMIYTVLTLIDIAQTRVLTNWVNVAMIMLMPSRMGKGVKQCRACIFRSQHEVRPPLRTHYKKEKSNTIMLI